LNHELGRELSRAVRERRGASVFAPRMTEIEQLKEVQKGQFIVLHSPEELKRFAWLDQKIKQIGFILPALEAEEAKKFTEDLRGYGFEFKETDKGLWVWVENLEKLLNRLGEEITAERKRAQAA
jgi:hypothetical protein